MSSNVFELPAPDDGTARDLTPADWARLERNAAEIFSALGLDLDTPGTRDTPRRFVRALFDATAGYDGDPKLRTVFPTEVISSSSLDLLSLTCMRRSKVADM